MLEYFIKNSKSWKCSSVTDHLPSIQKALNPVCSTEKISQDGLSLRSTITACRRHGYLSIVQNMTVPGALTSKS